MVKIWTKFAKINTRKIHEKVTAIRENKSSAKIIARKNFCLQGILLYVLFILKKIVLEKLGVLN